MKPDEQTAQPGVKTGPQTAANELSIYVPHTVAGGPLAAEPFSLVQGGDYVGAIIPEGYPPNHHYLARYYRGFWTPVKEQVAEAEAYLALFLETALHDRNLHPEYPLHIPRIKANLPKFRRQYVGVTVNNARVIFCNFFPGAQGDSDGRWRYSFVKVFDGGPSFWTVLFDPATKKFSRLRIDLGF